MAFFLPQRSSRLCTSTVDCVWVLFTQCKCVLLDVLSSFLNAISLVNKTTDVFEEFGSAFSMKMNEKKNALCLYIYQYMANVWPFSVYMGKSVLVRGFLSLCRNEKANAQNIFLLYRARRLGSFIYGVLICNYGQ